MLVPLLQRFAFTAIQLYEFLLIARAILSWLPLDYSNPIVQFLYSVTEPLLAPVRSLLHRISFFQTLPIDFAPLLVFILLDIIRSLLLAI